eukprot:TRINITY_DN5451_c2_g1_i1.p2 TRINITY_DN5451_c2_g1~~TRINITY_DN5451_c2_g1_i1.p2  ORF type:complete len:299 (+),score=86.05 TRINITY_DN5451_c2_g1_i1:49-897(+)
MTEQATKKRKFDPAALLNKFGWEQGKGLGKEGQGRSSYVTVQKKSQGYGLGADKSTFDEKERKVFNMQFDEIMKGVKKSVKGKSETTTTTTTSTTTTTTTTTETAEKGFVTSGTLVNGVMSTTTKTLEAVKEPDTDSDSDSSSYGPSAPITAMSDADLFNACGGVRFGKLGRHSNSEKKIQRIREAERTSGAKLVARAKERWGVKTRCISSSPVRSPAAAPRNSPRRSPLASPRQAPRAIVKTHPIATPSDKKEKKRKEKKEKKEKKDKKDKKEKKKRKRDE